MDAEQGDALVAELARLTDLVEVLVETQSAALAELVRIRERLDRAGETGW